MVWSPEGLNPEDFVPKDNSLGDAVRRSALQAGNDDPRKVAKAVDLSGRIGLPITALKNDPQRFDPAAISEEDLTRLKATAPKTASFLTEPDNYTLAKDDVNLLEKIEGIREDIYRPVRAAAGSAVSALGNILESGLTVSEMAERQDSSVWDFLVPGVAGLKQLGSLSEKYGLHGKLSSATQATADAVAGFDSQSLDDQDIVTQIGAGLGQLGVQAGAYAVNPILGLVTLAGAGLEEQRRRQEEAGTYGESGLTDFGLVLGAGESAAINAIPLEHLTRAIPASIRNSLVRRGVDILSSGLLNAATEPADAAAQMLIERYTSDNPDAKFGATVGSTSLEGITAALLRGIMHVKAPHLVGAAKEQTDILRGVAESKSIDDLAQVANSVKLRELSPETYKKYLQRIGADDSTIYVDGPQLALFLQGKTRTEIENDPALSLLDERLRERDSEDADVPISLTEFMQDVAPSSSMKELRPVMTMTQEATSPFRATEVTRDAQRMFEELEAEINQNEQGTRLRQEAQAYFEPLRDQLVGTGLYTREAADAMAKFYPAYLAAKAMREGKTIEEVAKEAPLEVSADLGEEPPPVSFLQREGDELPETQIKKPQEEGVTVTGYHYSPRDGLTELDPAQAGNGSTGGERRRFGRGNFGKRGGTAARVNFYVSEHGSVPAKESTVSGRNVYASRLTNMYPLDTDPLHIRRDAQNPDDMESRIASAGFNGYVTGKMHGFPAKVAVVFDTGGRTVPVAQVGRAPTFTQGGEAGPRGYYSPEQSLIRLTRARDMTTFLHEFAHFMKAAESKGNSALNQEINDWHRREAASVAEEASGYGQKQAVSEQDVHQFLDDGTTGDAAKDAQIDEATHEQFARAWERYLMEGKAPSKEMRPVFQRVMGWFIDTYRGLTSALRVNLDPQVRTVMDRLAASEDQLALVRGLKEYEPLFADAEAASKAGLSEADFEKLRAQRDQLENKEAEDLRSRLLKKAQALFTKKWKNERQAIYDEILPQVEDSGVHQARKLLKSDLKLDRGSVKRMVGVRQKGKLGGWQLHVPGKLRNMTATGGLGKDPDEVAAILGYGSGEEMLADVMNAPTAEKDAMAQAEQIMLERHGDFLHDGTVDRWVGEAMRDENRAKILLAELRALGRPKTERQQSALKAEAARRIATKTFRELRPAVFRKAETRAAREAGEALARGDKEAAARAEERRLVNFYLGKAAEAARTKMREQIKWTRRYAKKPIREAIQKAGDQYWDQIDGILMGFELRSTATLASVQQYNNDVKAWAEARQKEAGDTINLSEEVVNRVTKTHWKDMTPAQLSGVVDSLKSIEHNAQRTREIEIDGERQQFDAYAEKVASDIREHNKVKPIDRSINAPPKRKRHRRFSSADLDKVSVLASWYDGDMANGIVSMGPVHDLLVAENQKAYHRKQVMMRSVLDPVLKRQQALVKKDARWIRQRHHIPGVGDLTGEQIIAVALNSGNTGNIEAMLLGEGWAKTKEEATLANPKLQAVLSHMNRERMDFVQFVWNQMNLLLPHISETYLKQRGLKLEGVEAQPLTLPFGRYEGGYYPIVQDGFRSPEVLEAQREAFDSDSPFMNLKRGQTDPKVQTSATYERKGSNKPVELEMSVIANHFADVIHYVTHYDFIRNAWRTVSDPRVRSAMEDTHGLEHYALLKPWLRDLARDGRESEPKRFLHRVVRHLRTGTSVVYMTFKYSTGIAQLLGNINTIGEVGVGNYARMLMKLTTNLATLQNSADAALKVSRILPHRRDDYDREMLDADRQLSGEGWWGKWGQAGYAPLKMAQFYTVDIPAWYASYIKEMRNSGDHDRAVTYADSVVEAIQGSGRLAEQAAFFRSENEFARAIGSFMTFWSAQYNQLHDIQKGAVSGKYSTADVASRMLFMMVLPALAGAWFYGDLEKQDDESDADYAARVALNVALYPLVSMPMVRGVGDKITGGFDFTLAPLESTVDRGLNSIIGLAHGDFNERNLKGLTYTAGMLLHVPGTAQAWATGDHLYRVMEQGEDLTIHELLNGPDRK